MQLDFDLPNTATAPQLTGSVPAGFAGLTALRRWSLPRMNLAVSCRCCNPDTIRRHAHLLCCSPFGLTLPHSSPLHTVCVHMDLAGSGCRYWQRDSEWLHEQAPILQATLPNALVALEQLEQLELQDNKLSGSLPGWAGNLTWGQVTHLCLTVQNGAFAGCTLHDLAVANNRFASL